MEKVVFLQRSFETFCAPQSNLVKSTYRSLFGLQTNVNHEVRVRCKMLGGKNFGDFSDSVFVHIPSKGKHKILLRFVYTVALEYFELICLYFASFVHQFPDSQLWLCSSLELCL
ncbi:hypothetical protein ILYODFUR_011262 [Ilyodon furcidens]|uniref:Uncharacterized protein n=1 Tax=Ilyodon furcidens TaxID=33524 RepID=A0ABV0UF62_9TELE